MSDYTRRCAGAGAPQKGLFVDGIWHCECNPRQPANHFEVKKQSSPNLGKWFRTCQKQQDDKSRCKFFLWDSDAHAREVAALASNTRTEPSHAAPKTPSKRAVSPPPRDKTDLATGEPSRKRGRTTATDSDDEYGLGAKNESFRDEIDQVITQLETPRKAARTSELTTPSTRRVLPWKLDKTTVSNEDGLRTPQTGRNAKAEPFSSRFGSSLLTSTRPTDASQQTATPSSSPFDTPTPNRFKDVGGDDLVHDVLILLQDANVRLSSAAEVDLKALLARHTKAAEGLRRGRDVTRTTIKARDAKIAELSYRVSTLEAELEAERAMIKHLQWQMTPGNPSGP